MKSEEVRGKGQVMAEGKVSEENWRVKEFQRREQKKKKKNAYHIKPTPDRPPLAAVMLYIYIYIYIYLSI